MRFSDYVSYLFLLFLKVIIFIFKKMLYIIYVYILVSQTV